MNTLAVVGQDASEAGCVAQKCFWIGQHSLETGPVAPKCFQIGQDSLETGPVAQNCFQIGQDCTSQQKLDTKALKIKLSLMMNATHETVLVSCNSASMPVDVH